MNMRRPSTDDQLYAWHRAALSGEDPPINDGLPECGWFKTKLVKGGAWVPVRIWVEPVTDENGELTEPEILKCSVGSEMKDPARIWTYLTPITKEDYDALVYRITTTPQMMDGSQRVDLTQEAMRP